jgi:hypothetical protein
MSTLFVFYPRSQWARAKARNAFAGGTSLLCRHPRLVADEVPKVQARDKMLAFGRHVLKVFRIVIGRIISTVL